MMINNVNLGNAVHNGDTVDTTILIVHKQIIQNMMELVIAIKIVWMMTFAQNFIIVKKDHIIKIHIMDMEVHHPMEYINQKIIKLHMENNLMEEHHIKNNLLMENHHMINHLMEYHLMNNHLME